jgi:hypothetical protein
MATTKSVQVQARWKRSGGFEPTQFQWDGTVYRVESTGREWEDDQGYHVLCMIQGGKVFELIFHLNPAGWTIRPAAGGTTVA